MKSRNTPYSVNQEGGFFQWNPLMFGSYLLYKKFKKKLKNRPKPLSKLLTKEGKNKITKSEICRQPVVSIIAKLLNFLSLGLMKKRMEKMGYDKLYHLYFTLYLSNGKVVSLEKNERVKVIMGGKKKFKDTECKTIDYGGKKTLNQFILDVEAKNIEGFYQYSGFKNNCQKWVLDIMNTNGITEYNDFIKQKVANLAPSYLKWISNKVTDTAGVGRYITGTGKKCEDLQKASDALDYYHSMNKKGIPHTLYTQARQYRERCESGNVKTLNGNQYRGSGYILY